MSKRVRNKRRQPLYFNPGDRVQVIKYDYEWEGKDSKGYSIKQTESLTVGEVVYITTYPTNYNKDKEHVVVNHKQNSHHGAYCPIHVLKKVK